MPEALATLDWIILGGYLVLMLGMSAWLMRGQRDARDYYLGGNQTGALPIALSTMATQCSTNSLLGAPAFVAFTVGGGLVWLQYELAVPLAMAVLMVVVYPVFRRLRLISVYDYLEQRFGKPVRLAVAALFLLLRSFGTGITVYGITLVLQVILGVNFWVAVLLLGVVTIVYDTLGGMKAVIWSDVVQLVVLVGAIVGVAVVAVGLTGGLETLWQSVDADRRIALDFSGHGLGDGEIFAFWPMLIGGFFLYIAYYGFDQTQAQRTLSTQDVGQARKALFLGGLLRFPLVAAYCFVGVTLAAYAAQHPEFIDLLRLDQSTGQVTPEAAPNFNLAVPAFVFAHFPAGLIGLVVAGLFAAAMSSLDSTINSLSAVTLEDFIKPHRKQPLSERQERWWGRALTVFWGGVTLASAIFAPHIAPNIIEAINKVSSFLNGPLLALFAMGLLTRRINGFGALLGLIFGLGFNAFLWVYMPEVSWLWWNVFGALAAVVIALPVSLATGRPDKLQLRHTRFQADRDLPKRDRRKVLRNAALLIVYAAILIALLSSLKLL